MLEKLKAKLADVQVQKEQTLANLNCLIGAENMLLMLIQEESEDTENANNSD